MLYQKALASEKKKKGLFILPMRIMKRKKTKLPPTPTLHPQKREQRELAKKQQCDGGDFQAAQLPNHWQPLWILQLASCTTTL